MFVHLSIPLCDQGNQLNLYRVHNLPLKVPMMIMAKTKTRAKKKKKTKTTTNTKTKIASPSRSPR